MKKFTVLLLVMLLATGAHAQSMAFSCSGNDCYAVNGNSTGDLIVGTQSTGDVYVMTNQGGDDPEGFLLDDSVPGVVPLADGVLDLGTSSVEFKDAYFDGTVTTDVLVNSGASTLGAVQLTAAGAFLSDATNVGLDVAAAGNQACDTTCAVADGACLFGFDAGTTVLTDCANAISDTCVCMEPIP